MRRLLLLGVLAAACAGAVHVGKAQALSACGSITSSVTLTADCAAPLIVNASGITVDLGGHSVVCDSPQPAGIIVGSAESSATVRNGTIRGGLSTCVEGAVVDGDSNQFVSMKAFDAGNNGFVLTGNSNTLLLGTATFNGTNGVFLLGNDNTVRQGTFAGNSDAGVAVAFGAGNTVVRSRAFLNDQGIQVGGDSTVVQQNQSFRNNLGIYFTNVSHGSLATLNQTYQNNIGIWITDSTANVVVINGSYANFDLDMADDNTNCDSNIWFDNLFSTANQSCIH